MTWKWCAVLLMLFAWQACSAQKLVNLVEPQVAYRAPQPWPDSIDLWKLFDHDHSTYQRVHKGGYRGVQFSVQYPYSIRPTKYRIIMPAHVPSAKYPSSWTVKAKDYAYNKFTLDQVAGAVFKSGVYEGTFSEQIDMRELRINFDRHVVIAEVELLGPQSALDALWPYGDYPCSQRLAMLTSNRGPDVIFSKSKNSVAQWELRNVFRAKSAYTEFRFDGRKPVIVGAKLPSLSMVQEVSVDAWRLEYDGVKKVVLEGSLCEYGHCHRFGPKGWVWLGEGRPTEWNGPRIFVNNPGEYKAYRLKFIPKRTRPYNEGKRVTRLELAGLYFLGCTA